jgi:hypothetical protein
MSGKIGLQQGQCPVKYATASAIPSKMVSQQIALSGTLALQPLQPLVKWGPSNFLCISVLHLPLLVTHVHFVFVTLAVL